MERETARRTTSSPSSFSRTSSPPEPSPSCSPSSTLPLRFLFGEALAPRFLAADAAKSGGRTCTSSTTADVRPPTVTNEMVAVRPSGCCSSRRLQYTGVETRREQQRESWTHEREAEVVVLLLLALAPPVLEEPRLRETRRVGVGGDGRLGDGADLGVQRVEEGGLGGEGEVRGGD